MQVPHQVMFYMHILKTYSALTVLKYSVFSILISNDPTINITGMTHQVCM